MDDDPRFLARLRGGEPTAFDLLVRRYSGRMHAVARQFLPCEADGADAVQDTLLAAYRSLPTFQGNGSLWTWLYRVLVNACLRIRRAHRRWPVLSLDDLTLGAGEGGQLALVRRCRTEPAPTCAERAETQARVRALIARLPANYREVLRCRDLDELDAAQAAERLGLSRQALKSRLHRARRALRALLEAEDLRPRGNFRPRRPV